MENGTLEHDRVRDLDLRANDGVTLRATLFEPSTVAVASVVVASAMGVRRRLYSSFATYLASHGFRVLTFDYRGIGDSLNAGDVFGRTNLVDWAEQDLAAAHAHMTAQSPELPLLHIGHSVGGQLLALLPNVHVKAALMVGSQSGYHQHWPGILRPAMVLFWHTVPWLVRATGCLPMRALGQGEDIPPHVANQWAEWGRDTRYLGKYLEARDGAPTSTYSGPIRLYAVLDDNYAPPRSVRALTGIFAHAETAVIDLDPASVDARKTGHFGVFREKIGREIWAQQAAWLRAQIQE